MAIDGLKEGTADIARGLYVIATPIGNLGDMTHRAKAVIAEVDHLLCEDTRVTGKLLAAYGLKANLAAYHDHNGDQMRPKVLKWLEGGARVGLVSDAGTPLISDPGFKLVAEAGAAGHAVVPVPGASALSAALSVAGLPTDRVLFMGFPPSKSGARQSWFKDVKTLESTLVFYESTRRLPESLADAHSVLGDRAASVCREMTKAFEEVVRGDLESLALHYGAEGAPKGECVVVVGPPEKGAARDTSIDINLLLARLIPDHGVKGAAQIVAEVTGQPRKPLYEQALALKDEG